MRRAAPLGLHEGFRAGCVAFDRRPDRLRTLADDQRHVARPRRDGRAYDMGYHRQAGNRVQHLGQRALHARALTGGENYRQAGSCIHERKARVETHFLRARLLTPLQRSTKPEVSQAGQAPGKLREASRRRTVRRR